MSVLSGQPASVPAVSVWRRVFAADEYDVTRYLTAYLFLLMFIPSSLIFAPLGGSGNPALVYSLLISLWYLASWMTGKAAFSGGGKPIRIAMLIFALAVLASFVAGMTRDISQVEALSAYRGLIELAAWAGLVIVISQSVNTYSRLDALLRRAVIFGSVVAGIGIIEYYSGLNVTNYIHLPGLTENATYSTLQSRNGLNRPSSTAVDPIEFGVVMALLLPLALHQAIARSRAGSISRWVPVALIAFAIPMSVSRSAIVAAPIGCIILVSAWRARQRHTFYVFFALGLIALKVVTHSLIGTLLNYFVGMFGGGDGSVATRTDDYARDWPYIAQRPLFGRGFGTFLPQLYSWTDNMYLNSLIETGIFGLLSLLLLYLAGIHCAAAGRRLTQDEERRGLGQALIASIVVAAIGSATFDALDFPMLAGILFLILGAAGAYLAIMTRDGAFSPLPRVRSR
jgi:polysaccharide biosynthesis protein PslJ